MSRKNCGAVALEFLLVFPLVVGMVYTAAAYGGVFFQKYQLQKVVDRAASSAMSLDRSKFGEGADERAVDRASDTLEALISEVSGSLASRSDDRECGIENVGGVSLVECTVVADGTESPFVPQLKFGFLGKFPPLPDTIEVRSAVAF
ncbi:TadE/TadG family type IV pilus assembly protein [Marinobacter sp. HL-58]|uniref:TadE/TadG family type IV pilus assembly protein n=1 Tax=Marinobacter sp. HL-58 TaxID=1479237 RepID=UPI0004831289|nr:TadE/TadG family type IV pilus assembly protein [Marinobacter sp. HL-58]KPP97812.1 MAG: Tad secretion system assembly platform protein TadG [Marinobacter sp. HL-58]